MNTTGETDDDTTTPVDIDARRPDTPLGGAWFGLQRVVGRTFDRVRALRVEWSEARPDRQAALALAAADTFREFADTAHDLARQLEEFAKRRG
jgi:hypothetical protein